MIFLLLHWSLNKLCVYFQATMAFLYSVFHILVSCLWSQIKSFMGHEVYFCIILWFRTDRAVITSFDFGACMYFYSGFLRDIVWNEVWNASLVFVGLQFFIKLMTFTLSGGDGQQSHGVFTAQQTGQLHEPHAGRPGTRGGRRGWRCQEADSQGNAQTTITHH